MGMIMFLSWTIFLLFPIPNESKLYLVKTKDSDTDNIEPIHSPDYDDSDDWSNVFDGWGDESIDDSWDASEETTKGSSKKEGTTQTTQTTRADGIGAPDIPGSFTTTIGGYSYSNGEHTTMSCTYYYKSGASIQGQICLAPLGGWKTCRYPPDDCNLDWPKLYKDLKIAYEEHKETMKQLDRSMKKMDEDMAKMNEKFSRPCFPFC